MGLGCIFMGLYWMKEGMEPVRSMPAVVAAFKSLDVTTAWGLVKCVLVSLAFTAVVQSSAATTAIAMTLAQQGLLDFEAAAATVFGMNIGTTMTAWLAAPMADGHTIFNLVTTVFFLPFTNPFARFVARVIKADPSAKPHLSALSATTHLSPVIACDQALLEVAFMRDSDLELLSITRGVLAGEAEERQEEHVLHREGVLDNVQREIAEFLGKIMAKRAPAEVSARVRRLLRLSDELESVSDESAAILKATRRLRKIGQNFSPQSQRTLLAVHDRVAPFAERVSAYLKSPRPRFDLSSIRAEAAEIGRLVHTSRLGQLDRVGPDDPDSPIRVLAELDILNAYDRMRGYYLNIAETLAGGK